MRACTKAEARAKAEITRIATEVSKRSKIEAEVSSGEMADAAKRKIEEDGARIRASEEAKTEKRDRAEAEARACPKANIREKVEGEKEAAEDKAKIDAEAVERARVWAETEAKEKAQMARIATEAGLRLGVGPRPRP